MFIVLHSTLALSAYDALLTAFRAAGDLDEEKLDTLSIVRQSLKISDARHKVEVRRVAGNFDCFNVNGFKRIQDWRDEGFLSFRRNLKHVLIHHPDHIDSIQIIK